RLMIMAEKEFPVAVIGIACRLPEAENCSQFWKFISEKRDAIGELSAQRAKDIEHVVKRTDREAFVNADRPFLTGSFFETIDGFDSIFFGISPQEAVYIDPQHRFILRSAWEAIEDAGIAAHIFGSNTGVFMGYPEEKYLNILPEINKAAAIGTHSPFTAARVSYTFNLRGPSFLVNASSSSSLLAVHLACQALRNGDCDTAIAGGVIIDCLPLCLKTNKLNLTGLVRQGAQCRPFDNNAQYTATGEGCAVLVLKPLQNAIEDGNHIYGAIISSATRQNGLKEALSESNISEESALLINAWKKSAIDPKQIGYFEAHAAGIKLEDTSELCAIKMAFDNLNDNEKESKMNKPCIGSIKANFGNFGASGIVSLIKVLLSFHNNQIPPQTNFNTPNKSVEWKQFPFRVNTEAIEWKRESKQPRIAAISSRGSCFGYAGTSVHCILQDFEQNEEKALDERHESLEPILISAASQKSLYGFISKLKEFVSTLKKQKQKDANVFKNIAYTLNTGREHRKFSYKALLFAENISQLERVLILISEHLVKRRELNTKILSAVEFENKIKNGFICFALDSNRYRTTNALQTTNTSIFFSIYHAITNREMIPWSLIYKQRRPIVAQLPTYAFDEIRYDCHSNAINNNSHCEEAATEDKLFDLNESSLTVKNEEALVDNKLKKCLLLSSFDIPDFAIDFVKDSFGSQLEIKHWSSSMSQALLESLLEEAEMFVLIITDGVSDKCVNTFLNESSPCPLLIIELIVSGIKRDWNQFSVDNRKACLSIYEMKKNYIKNDVEESELMKHGGYLYLSSLITRNICSMLTTSSRKAIVVSDQIKVSDEVLSNFLHTSSENGVFRILWSKNNDSDKFRLVKQQNEHLLSEFDVSLSSTHEYFNLNELCKLLKLDVNKIVIVHDDMQECLKILEKYPSALILCLSDDELQTKALLDSIWSLDSNKRFAKCSKIQKNQRGDVISRQKQEDRFDSHLCPTLKDFVKQIESCRQWFDKWPKELKTQQKIHHLSPFLTDESLEQIIKESEKREQISALELAWFEQLDAYPKDDSHFFICGGDSLKAIYFISKIRKTLKIDINFKHLFLNPKFEDLQNAIQFLPSIQTIDADLVDVNAPQMSSMQNRFILLQELNPKCAAYTECCAVCGTVDDLNFETLLTRILKTFPILKTAITEDESTREKKLCQLALEELVKKALAPLIKVDSLHEAQNVACRLRPAFKMRDRSPLIRLQPVKIDIEKTFNTMVVIYVHHMLIDEISARLLQNAIRCFLENRTFPYDQPEKNFLDFVREEYVYLSSTQKQNDLKSIAEQFTMNPPESSLSFTDQIWSDTKTYDAKRTTFELNELNLKAVCDQLGISHFHYYFCCFLLTLRRYTSENDLIVNIPRTTRSCSYENAFGPFLNIILFRFEFDASHSLKKFILNAVKKWIKAQEKNLLPFDEVVSFLRDSKKLGRIQIYNWFNYSFAEKDNSVNINSKHARFPFSVNVRENSQSVELIIEWADELIDDHIAQNFGASFANACLKIADDFDKLKNEPALSIDVMPGEEMTRILSINREMDSNPNLLAHKYFEKHCENNGEKIAVVSGDRKVTYNQLNEMANKLGAYLQREIPREDVQKKPIVIMMKRDEFVIASVFAIWKIGAYFLAISDDTQQKLHQILLNDASDFQYVLINFDRNELEFELPSSVKLIDVRKILEQPCDYELEDNLASFNPSDTFAYICLTSGTTGKPKRCLITHEGLAIFGKACLHDYKMDSFEMRLVNWLPISFDVFINDISFVLLMAGGTFIIVQRKFSMDPRVMEQIFIENKASFILATPQFASSVILKMSNESLQYLRLLLLATDSFYQNIFRKLREKLDESTQIVNAYGPTETTVGATFFNGELKYKTTSGLVPIGKSLRGIFACIVDPITKMLSPFGAIGEICICGRTVGKGDVKTTMLEFTGDQPVFMTGDYGRMLPDGNIDFIGRKDSSFLKVHGFRIITKINKVPMTEHGKIDLNSLKQLCLVEQTIAEKFSEHIKHDFSLTHMERTLLNYLTTSLSSSLPIDVDTNFRDQGIHSLALMKFANLLLSESIAGFEGVADLFDYPNIKLLAQKIEKFSTIKANIKTKVIKQAANEIEIAIVGVAFRLPKDARSFVDLWAILNAEKSLIDDFPHEREIDVLSRLDELNSHLYKDAKKFKGAFLSSIKKFDNQFFAIPAAEAKHMCPEQRLWMHVAIEALHDSGHINDLEGKNLGQFFAASHPEYEKVDSCNDAIAVVGKLGSMITRRVSYQYNLKGPAVNIDTACSSGLVAFHEACEAIKSGICDSAIVGGVSLYLYPSQIGTHSDKMGTISPDFCCRAFDEKANGTVAGEGVIAFVLEPLQKALENKKHIYGIVKGTAINSVGRSNGITAPSKSSQKEVIENALNAASLSPSEVNLIESHGTGTELGDLIEIEALKSVFNENPNPVILGTSKPNFGHLNQAAGVLKMLAIFMFKAIPRALHFDKPNKALIDSNIVVPTEEIQIESENFTAGISAFGLSGTNAHCILRKFCEKNNDKSDRFCYEPEQSTSF
ncbi:hypothetical protein B4U79_07780, partial [Dinothrombium tinctorium]